MFSNSTIQCNEASTSTTYAYMCLTTIECRANRCFLSSFSKLRNLDPLDDLDLVFHLLRLVWGKEVALLLHSQ